MDAASDLRAFLLASLPACLDRGHWAFSDPYTGRKRHAEERIAVDRMYQLHDGWTQLAADVILAQSTGGVVGIRHTLGSDWMSPLIAALEQHGAELPFTAMTPRGEVVTGDDWVAYPPGQPVTIFNEVNTLGVELRSMRSLVEKRGLRVARMVSLVHRGPELPGAIAGIPYSAAVHFPLPLVVPGECFDCLLGRPARPLIA